MIEVIFLYGTEVILVVVNGNDVRFGSTTFGARLAGIEGLRLSYEGVCREFPDLETKDNWREEAIKRFKDKIASFKTEDEKVDYIIKDLTKFGYVAKKKQRKGFRPEVIK